MFVYANQQHDAAGSVRFSRHSHHHGSIESGSMTYVSEHTVQSHLVVLVTRHDHEADVWRRERTLEQRNTFAARQSHASLVRRFADGTDSNTFVVENNAYLVGEKRIAVQRSTSVTLILLRLI